MLHATAAALKYYLVLGSCAVVALCTLYVVRPTAQSNASPIYGVTIPAGYRDWKLIAVNQLKTDKVDQLRAQLGNEIAIKAFKEGTVPFPDGTVFAALHWNRVPSEDNNEVLVDVFPGAQSFVVEFADGGYTIERGYLGKTETYNDIANWSYADLPKVFRRDTRARSFVVKTVKDLQDALSAPNDALIFVESIMDRLSPP